MTSFENQKANAIKKATKKIEQLKKELAKAQLALNHPSLAIVGVGCNFPGGSCSPETFWDNLVKGYDCISDVPADRWDAESYFSPDLDAPGKINSKKGGFLKSDLTMFDADFFGISPIEAKSMDPQQRLVLETTWQALENAAINPLSLRGTATGVYIGSSTNDYGHMYARLMPDDKFNAYYGTGNSSSVTAGRVAYILGTHGPAIACDSSCSSSSVALHLGCKSLTEGETDLVIVGGVNLILSPQNSIGFTKANMLSPDGHCKTFDARADGHSRGEGCGIVIIKRLDEAIEANDRILCVIKGSAVNHSGHSSGLTVPNADAELQVMNQALKNSKLNPADIDYIETHGTGSALGDPIEIEAIKSVFSIRDYPLTIGTVKANIGHLECASGIAGVIKVVLSLQYEKIPKHLNFNKIHPLIDLESFKGIIPLKTKEWKRNSNRVRRAGVSAFGLNGTNVHIVLEEAPAIKSIAKTDHNCFLFCFSAKSPEALKAYLIDFATFLDKPINKKLHPADVSYTLNTGRGQYKYRSVIIANSLLQLRNYIKSNHFFLEKDLEEIDSVEAKSALEFLKGQQVDFDSIYTYPVSKISLPYYVFQKKRYWLTNNTKLDQMTTSEKIHPLLSLSSPNIYNEKSPFVTLLKRTSKEKRKNLLTNELKKIVAAALSIEDEQMIHEHREFIEFGIDSLMIVNMWNRLKEMVGNQYTLSKSLLIECTSVAKLTEYFQENVFEELFEQPMKALKKTSIPAVLSAYDLNSKKSSDIRTNQDVETRKIVKKRKHDGQICDIFITGASGALGGYITKLLLENTEITIHCLLRGTNEVDLYHKLRNILKIYQTQEHLLNSLESRVQMYCGDISCDNFSLASKTYEYLVNITDLTIHAAAKFSSEDTYEQLYDTNVLGTKNIIKFAQETQDNSLIYISSYSIMGDLQISKNPPFKESDFDLGQGFKDLGYQKTKFESERMVREAGLNGLKWRIIRSGEIFGDSKTGSYPLSTENKQNTIFYDLLKTAIDTNIAANTGLYIDITPVDYVAKGILHIILNQKESSVTYHLTNPDVKTFPEVINILCDLGYPIKLISSEEYLKLVYTYQLKHNKRVYNSLTTSRVRRYTSNAVPKQSTPVDATKTSEVLAKAAITCPKIDKGLLSNLLQYCVNEGYIFAKLN